MAREQNQGNQGNQGMGMSGQQRQGGMGQQPQRSQQPGQHGVTGKKEEMDQAADVQTQQDKDRIAGREIRDPGRGGMPNRPGESNRGNQGSNR